MAGVKIVGLPASLPIRPRRELSKGLFIGIACAVDTIRINAVNLKDRLHNIDADCGNLADGRLPSMWFVANNHLMALRCRRAGAVRHIIRVVRTT